MYVSVPLCMCASVCVCSAGGLCESHIFAYATVFAFLRLHCCAEQAVTAEISKAVGIAELHQSDRGLEISLVRRPVPADPCDFCRSNFSIDC